MSLNISEAKKLFDGSKHYQAFLQSLSSPKKIKCNLEGNALSRALYYHIFRIQLAGWEYMDVNNRANRHPISEIAQDIIGYFINAALPNEYSIKFEVQGQNRKPRVDIAILKNGLIHFMIEVKTNLGYQRHTINKEIKDRRNLIAKNFNLDESKVIYILLSDGNVNRDFSAHYWDSKTDTSVEVKDERRFATPYNFIFPLFHESDPRYMKHDEKKSVKYTDAEILDIAEHNIITPLEHIISLIINED